MKNDKTEISISKVEIKIAGETLRLTLEQAKELQNILNKAFPQEKSVKYVPHYVDRHVYIDRPLSPWKYEGPNWTTTTVLCNASKTVGQVGNSAILQLSARS